MRQTLLTLSVLLVMMAAIAAIATGPASRAQQTLPTPEGQLGGPMPLPTQGQPGNLPSPTTPPTPTIESATPAAGVPHPAACRVAARSIEELIVLAHSDVPPPPSDDGGVPADAATADGVLATAHELVACLNAGDQLRVAALLTDDYLARLLADTGWAPDEVLSILGPLLPRAPERWIAVAAVTDACALPDGGAVATVVLFDPERFPLGTTSRHRFVFAHDGDRWLVDDVLPLAGT
ncbi:MAG: hypothetical protein ACRDJW_04105 [Thermomicrobiales bacterium]